MADDLAGQWVGPMPVKTFIKAFFKLGSLVMEDKPEFQSDYFAFLDQTEDEEKMNNQFIKAVEDSETFQRFRLVNTSSHRNTTGSGTTGLKQHPPISCYANRPGPSSGDNASDYNKMELIIELKPHTQAADPFDDDGRPTEGVDYPFEPTSNEEDIYDPREECRKQLVYYTNIWSAQQHRTHCFILWLGDPYARLIRMDRAGGIVSAKFNFRTDGHLLLNFLWHFSRSSARARGHDITVEKASILQSRMAKSLLTEANFVPTTETDVLRILVPDEKDPNKFYKFYVWGSVASPKSATGRATRGYPAVDPLGNDGNGSVVFLKDAWRSWESTEKESAIIADLNKEKCRNVPELVCGNDLDQFTLTKHYAKKSWNIGGRPEGIVKRVHTRFAQKEVGYHLDGFKSTKDLLQAIYDSFVGHKDAYEKCGILHRDISDGNILMRQDGSGGGFLNDWDLAKRVNQDVLPKQTFAIGTWQFMSVKLLNDAPDKENTLQDDLESFIWLLLYHVLRYTNHNLPSIRDRLIKYIFNDGRGKSSVINPLRGPLGSRFAIVNNKPLTLCIEDLLESLEQWYRVVSDHERKILDAEEFLNITYEEALKEYPFDDNDADLRDHDEMIDIFEWALETKCWPKSDKALDQPVPEDGGYSEEQDLESSGGSQSSGPGSESQ